MDILFMPQDEAIQVLIRLGLTRNQSKVYLSLVQSGVSTAKTISKASHVAREDIYRIIPTLQELGLVEKIIDTTSMYSAVPLPDGFKILMKSRKQLTIELQTKTQEIIQNFKNNNSRTTPEEERELILFPGERAIIKIKKMIDNAQRTLDFITSWGTFAKSSIPCNSNLRNALKKNVAIRIIVEKIEDEKSLLAFTKSFKKYSSFRVHLITSNPDACFMLVDSQKVLFANSSKTSFEETPFLWATNRSLVSIMKEYFEVMWLKSLEINKE